MRGWINLPHLFLTCCSCFSLWQNLLEKSAERETRQEYALAMIQCKVLKQLENLEQQKYDDEDITEDIKFLLERLGESVQDLRYSEDFFLWIIHGKVCQTSHFLLQSEESRYWETGFHLLYKKAQHKAEQRIQDAIVLNLNITLCGGFYFLKPYFFFILKATWVTWPVRGPFLNSLESLLYLLKHHSFQVKEEKHSFSRVINNVDHFVDTLLSALFLSSTAHLMSTALNSSLVVWSGAQCTSPRSFGVRTLFAWMRRTTSSSSKIMREGKGLVNLTVGISDVLILEVKNNQKRMCVRVTHHHQKDLL